MVKEQNTMQTTELKPGWKAPASRTKRRQELSKSQADLAWPQERSCEGGKSTDTLGPDGGGRGEGEGRENKGVGGRRDRGGKGGAKRREGGEGKMEGREREERRMEKGGSGEPSGGEGEGGPIHLAQ